MEYLPLGIILGLFVLGYGWYVTLITRRNKVHEALSSVDVQLRKRHDLLPNILKLAQKFMSHEKELLDRLTALRSRAQAGYAVDDPDAVKQHLEAERGLQAAAMQLFAVAENYPELRSSETVQQAQQTFTEVEGHISAARRFYNAAVTSLNNACEIFPGTIIAGWAKVRPMPFFEIEESVRAPVDVDDYMKA